MEQAAAPSQEWPWHAQQCTAAEGQQCVEPGAAGSSLVAATQQHKPSVCQDGDSGACYCFSTQGGEDVAARRSQRLSSTSGGTSAAAGDDIQQAAALSS